MEQLRAYAARTAEGEQHAPRLQNLEGQAVDVLVSARGAVGVGCGGGKLGRVEHDGVKCAALAVKLAQGLVDVGVEERSVGLFKAIELRIPPRAGNGGRRGVDGGDVPALCQQAASAHAGQGRHAEAPGVAITIEDTRQVQAGHVLRKQVPTVALIQVKAGFVAFDDVQGELPIVLAQGQLGALLVAGGAAQPTGGGGQAFELAHPGIRALVQPGQTRQGQQAVGNDAFPALGAAGEKLRHQRVTIAVHDQAWKAVRLAMNQPHAVASDVKAGARRDGLGQPTLEKTGIDAFGLVKAPDARTDLGGRAESGPT